MESDGPRRTSADTSVSAPREWPFGEIQSLVRDVVRLARSWWRVDRIRVSPREGRLLALLPGERLLVFGRPVVVIERIPSMAFGGVGVRYRCATETGCGELFVARVPGTSAPVVTWREGGVAYELFEEDVDCEGEGV
jgi:hypothetical protein